MRHSESIKHTDPGTHKRQVAALWRGAGGRAAGRRGLALGVLALLLVFGGGAAGQIEPEVLGVATMPAAGENWFVAKTGNGAYIWDGESGEMRGMLSLSRRTPAVAAYPPRQEFYAAESYMARGVHGQRTDIVAVYDFANLSPVAEVTLPERMARLPLRRHLGLLNNGRHLAVMNMNPGYSVSIVDVADKLFIYEISTPGCAMLLPVAEDDFLMVCGDGSLQMIRLDVSGFEDDRVRSRRFFDVQEDPVFDRSTRTAAGWLLITHSGTVFEVGAEGGDILISDGWDIVAEGLGGGMDRRRDGGPGTGRDAERDGQARGWRPGGREFLSVHRNSGLLYVAMHEGPVDSHHEPGSEIWVLDLNTRRLVHRMEMTEGAVDSLLVTQEAEPILVVATEDGGTHIYDAFTFRHRYSLDAPAAQMFEDF